MKVTDGNDGALAAGIALAATMQSFVCTHATSHVGIKHDPQSSKQLYSREWTPYQTKARRAAGRDWTSRLDVGLPPTKLLMQLTEQLLI